MKSFIKINLGVLLFLSSLSVFAQQTTTVYLIRHAEKVKSDPSDRNPHLNTKGVHRSHTWANFFKDIPLDAIYSTSYHRTEETVKEIALKKNLKVKNYAPSNEEVASIVNNNLGKNLLFVGHSNTVPGHTNHLLGHPQFVDMSEGDNHSLFIVQLENGSANVVRIFVD
jgi:2,3-bisphosphoglycerate-dependent phosphoglycerate mutase